VKNSSRLSTSEDVSPAAQGCADCHQYCIEALVHCRQRGGAYTETSHLRQLQDCAEVCRTTADLLLRGSDYAVSLGAVCAEVAEGCASSCEQFLDDRLMRTCAGVCRRCALVCRELGRDLSIPSVGAPARTVAAPSAPASTRF